MFNKILISKKWSHKDILWVLSLFGTAVGAGILFMPINAGLAGFWFLVFMTPFIWAITFFSHRGLARLVLSSKKGSGSIISVVEEHFGNRAGKLITFLYFFSIYPILLIYGVGITNTVSYFLSEKMGLTPPPRVLLSFFLILAMMFVMWKGEKIMLKVTEFLVYPLVGFLFFVSVYLIPYWNLSILYEKPCFGDCISTLWLVVPVLIFSFNHSPIISSFTQSTVRDHGKGAEKKINQILSLTATTLLGFVMFFVFSCVLSLRIEDLLEAKDLNISILSYFSKKFESPILSYLAPLVALLAIISSFFGHYLGAKEGLMGLLPRQKKKSKKRETLVTLFFFFSIWFLATINPSILGMIEVLSGPIIAIILFLLPMFAVYYVDALKKYRGALSNIFVVIVGLVAFSSLLYNLFVLFVLS